MVWDSRGYPLCNNPFIFGDSRNPNHRAPNHQLIFKLIYERALKSWTSKTKKIIPGKPRKVPFFLGNWIAGFRGKVEGQIDSNGCFPGMRIFGRIQVQKASIWSNYSDLTRPHPKRWFSKGNPLISRKSSLVKYNNLAGVLTDGCFGSLNLWSLMELT